MKKIDLCCWGNCTDIATEVLLWPKHVPGSIASYCWRDGAEKIKLCSLCYSVAMEARDKRFASPPECPSTSDVEICDRCN